jgi:hypothetical protein
VLKPTVLWDVFSFIVAFARLWAKRSGKSGKVLDLIDVADEICRDQQPNQRARDERRRPESDSSEDSEPSLSTSMDQSDDSAGNDSDNVESAEDRVDTECISPGRVDTPVE